jgi:hypothetical protein
MAFCSAVTLCFASIFSLAAAALLAIAFSTDNWQTISVNKQYNAAEVAPENVAKDLNLTTIEVKQSPLFFTRTRGLFRECYPGPKDKAPNHENQGQGDTNKIIELYMSPVETWCRNINYFIPEEGKTKQFTVEQMTKIHMSRAMIALFIVAFFFMFVSFTTGIVGCWRTSPSNIQASAVLMLLACLLSGGAMGLWHGCEYYEHEKIGRDALCDLPSHVQEGSLPSCPLDVFVKRWPGDGALLSKTTFKYDWSYIVSWIGVGMTLCSAILFFLAAVCIKNDKEREDAMNLQYLMPVYPQKQQSYGPYGYAAYPGPAAYYGSQYGLPYNQY